ncbi:MAG: precorrin-8X methylmutase [Chthoniobacteraceae bacterium]|nr:precorrin-8X methylmutase [Chthoniobacteraceae bacterium]
MNPVPFIHQLLKNPISGPGIEARSFEIIDREAPGRCGFPADQWEIVRRMIHTTGDIGLASLVRFSPDAIASGIAALRRGAAIYADSNMIRSGLSLARLRGVNPGYAPERITCHVADRDVAGEAAAQGLPRSLFAIRKAKPLLHGGIAVFGNAPVALLELNRMIIEEGIRPALVIGMPVGFVHVVESKEELATLGIPFVGIEGRRGGSTLAVATLHALCTLATQSEKEGGEKH